MPLRAAEVELARLCDEVEGAPGGGDVQHRACVTTGTALESGECIVRLKRRANPEEAKLRCVLCLSQE